jgi:hypothetical protein
MKKYFLIIIYAVVAYSEISAQCLDSLAMNASSLNVCSGTSVNITANVNGSTPTNSISYVWSSGDSTASVTLIPQNDITIYVTISSSACVGDTLRDSVFIAVGQQAFVNAGNDQTICQGSVVSLAGTISGSASSASWRSSGTGTFGNASSLSTNYIPGQADITAGSITLTLTSDDPVGPCAAALSQIVIEIRTRPFVDAGNDFFICSNASALLEAVIVGEVNSVSWSSIGSGAFTGLDSLSAYYVPSINDTSSDSVLIIATTNDPAGPCNAVSDTVIVFINQDPIVNAGLDQTICIDSLVQLNGSFSGGASSVTWSTSGSGLFTDSSNLYANYFPSNADLLNGSVVLTLTTDDPDGPCVARYNEMSLSFSPQLGTTNGPLNNICKNSAWNLYENNCSDCSLSWGVNGGSIQGNNANNSGIYVQWDNNSVNAPSLFVTVTSLITGCVSTVTIVPTFSNTTAPELHDVIMVDPNYNLLAINQTNYNFYSWGYIPKNQPAATYIVSSGYPYNAYSSLDVSNNYYWVEYGNDGQCLTRAYYNPPIVSGTEVENFESLDIFPNPFSDYIQFRGLNDNCEIEVYNQLGICIFKNLVTPTNNYLNTTDFQNGVYFVSFKTKNSQKTIFKLVK